MANFNSSYFSLLGLLLFFTIPSPYVRAASSTDVKNLLNDLFITKSYNKVVRPKVNMSSTTDVTINLYLVYIEDVNEVRGKISTTAYLQLQWTDEHLSWDVDAYGGLDFILIPQKQLWVPDLVLENGVSKLKALGDDFVLVNVTHYGNVNWFPYEVFESKCVMNVEYFPFDVQTCDIHLGLWMNDNKVDVKIGRTEIILDFYEKNGEWDILSTSAYGDITPTANGFVTFKIKMKRKPEYYLYNVVVPILLLSLISVFTFIIPVESGEKLGFAITVYLTFIVFLTIVSSSLPVSPSLSLLGMYLIFLLVSGTLIILITAVQLRIHFRDDSYKIPDYIQTIIICRWQKNRKVEDSRTVEVECTGGISYDRSETETTDVKSDRLKWPDISAAIEYYCFWIFLLNCFIGTVVIFLNGFIKSNNG